MKKAVIFDFYGVLVNQGVVNDELVAVLGELKAKGINIYLISASDQQQSAAQAAQYEFLKTFDKLYYTWQVGHSKSEPQAYQFILADQGLKPEGCLYFDDAEANVAAAKDAGIEAYLFENAAQVREKSGI